MISHFLQPILYELIIDYVVEQQSRNSGYDDIFRLGIPIDGVNSLSYLNSLLQLHVFLVHFDDEHPFVNHYQHELVIRRHLHYQIL